MIVSYLTEDKAGMHELRRLLSLKIFLQTKKVSLKISIHDSSNISVNLKLNFLSHRIVIPGNTVTD